MIKFDLVNNKVNAWILGGSTQNFSKILRILKANVCRWNKETKSWIVPTYNFESLRNELEEIDEVENHITPEAFLEIDEGKPNQIIDSPRRIPDYNLMNFGPIQGKHPNENFQHNGIIQGINRSCYCYAWGMGSGKSYVASTLIAHRYLKYKDCAKVVLLTTNIGVLNLYHELFKFIKNLDSSKVAVANKDFRDPFDHKEIDIVVSSYNSWRLVCNYYKNKEKITSSKPRKAFLPLEDWAENKPLMLILDESHCVSNNKSQQGNFVIIHAPLFKYRYEFSGTYADKIEKEYTQFKILDPWLVWNLSYSDWLNKMARIGNHYSRYAIREWKKEEVEKQNQRFVKSYGSFWGTADIVDLPNYNEKKIYIPMTQAHRNIYETFVMQDLLNLRTSRDIVSRFPFMMLSIDNPFLLEKHQDKFTDSFREMLGKFRESQLAKYDAVDDILADHESEKGIIWAIHPDTINRLGERYKKYSPVCITGGTEQSERFKLVEEFKKGKHQLLIANITCLNTSVTITEATFQVYVERTFDYTTYSQSTARAYRIGQDKDVTSYILMYDRSLDILLDRALRNKGILTEGLVKKDFLSQEQWKQIFNCTEDTELEDLDKVEKLIDLSN